VLVRNYARKLLALAHASRQAAHAEAMHAYEHLQEGQKMVELLRLHTHVTKVRLKEADKNISVVRHALDAMHIPEVSFSDDEGGDDEIDCVPVFHLSDSDSD
jgi:hypothetical protein